MSLDGFCTPIALLHPAISIWPSGCHLLGSSQAYLKFPLFCCFNLFSPVHLNLHCCTDFINLLFLLLREFSCQQFIHFGLHRLWYYLFLESTLLLIKSLQRIILHCEGSVRLTLWANKQKEFTYCLHCSHYHFIRCCFDQSFPVILGAGKNWSTASVLIMHQICFPSQELLFIQSNRLWKHWRPRYCGTDVNQLSNWFFTFLAFRYLSCQRNKSLTKPKSSWCNSSGCQRR